MEEEEEICERLITHVFPSEEVYMDTTLHADYINDAIDASDSYCPRLQQAYRHCTFCASKKFRVETQLHWYRTKCGDQPTLEQVLADNSTETGANRLQTPADVEATCDLLLQVYTSPVLIPRSIVLAQQQNLIKHLCFDECQNGCFDPKEYPTTCEPYQGTVFADLDTSVLCDNMYGYLYYWLGNNQLNHTISLHASYLRAIPGGTDDCVRYRQAYPSCSWCSSTPCFDPIVHPATCDSLSVERDGEIFQNPERMKEVLYYCNLLTQSLLDDENFLISPVPTHSEKLNFAANTEFCDYSHEYYKYCYWCAPGYGDHNDRNKTNTTTQPETQNPVELCRTSDWCSYEGLNNANDIVYQYRDFFNVADNQDPSVDCEKLYHEWSQSFYFRYTYIECFQDLYLHHICRQEFCLTSKTSDIDYTTYLGADTLAQKKALVWMSRAAALLSLGGSLYILYDILWANQKTRSTVYHQLLIGMAIFDIITALAWAFASAPIDSDKEDGWWIYGAAGNEATCTAQGFFIQLGFTSIFYNVSLATYYVLVISYGWRESRLKPMRLYLHGIPIVIGLGLAVGGIPIYHWMTYGCHILPPPDGELWQALVFVVLPLGISILAITGSMGVVYMKVRERAKAGRRWTIGGRGRTNKMERDVFWQCFFYVLAFYVTWPILFAVYLASIDVDGPLGLSITIAFVAPLQGFNNFLVFIRTKFVKRGLISRNQSSTSRTSLTSRFFGERSSLMRGSFFNLMRSMNFNPRNKDWSGRSMNDWSGKDESDRDGPAPFRRLNSSLFSSSVRQSEVSFAGESEVREEEKEEIQPQRNPAEPRHYDGSPPRLDSSLFSSGVHQSEVSQDDDGEGVQEQLPQEKAPAVETMYYEMDPSALIAQDDYDPDADMITMQQAEDKEQPMLANAQRLETVREDAALDYDDDIEERREMFTQEGSSNNQHDRIVSVTTANAQTLNGDRMVNSTAEVPAAAAASQKARATLQEKREAASSSLLAAAQRSGLGMLESDEIEKLAATKAKLLAATEQAKARLKERKEMQAITPVAKNTPFPEAQLAKVDDDESVPCSVDQAEPQEPFRDETNTEF